MKNTLSILVVAATILTFLTGASSAAAIGLGSISGTVYLDAKCNGLDLSDKPLANTSAVLTSKILKFPLKTKSDAQGNIRFSNLKYGLYSVRVTAGSLYQPSDIISLYQISEVNGAASEIFVFCKKVARF